MAYKLSLKIQFAEVVCAVRSFSAVVIFSAKEKLLIHSLPFRGLGAILLLSVLASLLRELDCLRGHLLKFNLRLGGGHFFHIGSMRFEFENEGRILRRVAGVLILKIWDVEAVVKTWPHELWGAGHTAGWLGDGVRLKNSKDYDRRCVWHSFLFNTYNSNLHLMSVSKREHMLPGLISHDYYDGYDHCFARVYQARLRR